MSPNTAMLVKAWPNEFGILDLCSSCQLWSLLFGIVDSAFFVCFHNEATLLVEQDLAEDQPDPQKIAYFVYVSLSSVCISFIRILFKAPTERRPAEGHY